MVNGYIKMKYTFRPRNLYNEQYVRETSIGNRIDYILVKAKILILKEQLEILPK